MKNLKIFSKFLFILFHIVTFSFSDTSSDTSDVLTLKNILAPVSSSIEYARQTEQKYNEALGTIEKGEQDGADIYKLTAIQNGRLIEVTTTPLGGQAFSYKIDGEEMFIQPPNISEITSDIFNGGMPVATGSYVNRVPKNGENKARITRKGKSVDVEVRHPWGDGAAFAIHGSTWSDKWNVKKQGYLEEHDAVGITYELDSSLSQYSDVRKDLFSDLIFRLTYFIKDGELNSVFECINPEEKEKKSSKKVAEAPVQVTWHPWMALEGNRDEWELLLPFENYWEVDNDGFPTGKQCSAELVPGFKKWIDTEDGQKAALIELGNENFDHMFTGALRDGNGNAKARLRNKKRKKEYTVNMDKNLNDFVFYSTTEKKLNHYFACMEPSKGPANGVNLKAINNLSDIFELKPGESVKVKVSFGQNILSNKNASARNQLITAA